VQLLYGDNQIRIVLYGPQGQIRTREETINVGQDNVPPGKTWYWAGFNQPGRDILTLEKPPDWQQPKAQATLAVEHGIDERTSVGVLAREMLIDDERVTFLEGTVRRSVGQALIEVGVARQSNGGTAAHAQLLAKFGQVNVSAEALLANDFHLLDNHVKIEREARLTVDAPLRIGRAELPVHADVHLTDLVDGTSQLEAAARLSANLSRFNLSTAVRYQRYRLALGPAPPGDLILDFFGTGHIGDVRLRAGTSFDVFPISRLRTAELSAYWSKSDRVDWEGGLVYDVTSQRTHARITHVRRLNSMALALTGEAATDRSFALGFNLSFSLDPRHGLFFSRRPLAQAGSVHGVVYRDLNDNGVRDANEPFEKGALLTTGTALAERPTDTKGSVTVAGLTAYRPVAVGIDQSSLGDPMLVPKTALQVVVPRPGVPAEVEIGLVGGGDIEGALTKNGGLGFEGLDLELVDEGSKVVATARTDFDGFFLFERAPYGVYTIRIARDSAIAAKVGADLGIRLEINDQKPVVRLGAVQVRPLPVVASAGATQDSALK
jgi:hypothetical protein